MITVLTGVNSHALATKLNKTKLEFTAKHGKAGVEVLDGIKILPEELGSLLGGVTLFASSRLIIIKNLSGNKILADKFINSINSISEEIKVVLVETVLDKRTAFYKTLKKESEILEFGPISEPDMAKWIKEEVTRQNGSISASAIRKLIEYVGVDQARMQNELDKLTAYNSEITEETINELVEPNPQETIFQLLEFSLSGQTAKALEVLDKLERAHEDPFQTASMLIWQTHILALVYAAKNISESEIAKQAKINPYVVQKTKNLARTMSKIKINQIIEAVAECDVRLKTNAKEPWRIVEQAILSI